MKPPLRLLRVVTAGATVVAAAAGAQSAPVARTEHCDGKTISTIDIQQSSKTMVDKNMPAFSRVVLQFLLLGTPTKAYAVRPYLQLHEGGKCTEERRAESERLLRQLPYIADATVQLFDEPDGAVRAVVETVDDIRPIIGLGIRGSRPNDVELGNSSINGSGQLAAVRWRDGRAFRDGWGFRYSDFHLFGGQNVGQLSLEREPLGTYAQAAIARPFFSDLQHIGGYAGFTRDEGYLSYVRPEGNPLSVKTLRERSDAGLAFRINTFGTVSWMIGVLGSFEHRNTGNTAVVITDSTIKDTVAAPLQKRYADLRTTRVGGVLGIRVLQFMKVTAFDGLEGAQDVARGAQLAATYGRGVTTDDKRPFVTADFYAGVGTAASFLGLRVVGEATKDASGWGNNVASGRLAWYIHASERWTQLFSVEYAGSTSDSVPYQLTMADAQSGLRGYTGSRLSGGRRVIGRVERRVILPGAGTYLGWGFAAFGDVGQMWAAKVPFGENGTRGSLGLSLLAAVPRESRSVARVDVAYPLVKDLHAKGVEVRVSYRSFGRAFWREPTQIARARLGSPTTDIFTWP